MKLCELQEANESEAGRMFMRDALSRALTKMLPGMAEHIWEYGRWKTDDSTPAGIAFREHPIYSNTWTWIPDLDAMLPMYSPKMPKVEIEKLMIMEPGSFDHSEISKMRELSDPSFTICARLIFTAQGMDELSKEEIRTSPKMQSNWCTRGTFDLGWPSFPRELIINKDQFDQFITSQSVLLDLGGREFVRNLIGAK